VEARAQASGIEIAADDHEFGAAPLTRLPGAIEITVDGWLELYAPSQNRPQPRRQGRVALCLQRQADGPGALAVLQAWITTALDLGATAEDPPRQEPFGAEAWLLDPEGNRLLLLVLPAS
jgi:hypothetical protein